MMVSRIKPRINWRPGTTECQNGKFARRAALDQDQQHLPVIGDRRVPDKNGEVDPTIFPAVNEMQLGA
jgi:hypothetical protein